MFTLPILRLVSFCFLEHSLRGFGVDTSGMLYIGNLVFKNICVCRCQGERPLEKDLDKLEIERLLYLTYQPPPKVCAESTPTLNYRLCLSVLTQRLAFSQWYTHAHNTRQLYY